MVFKGVSVNRFVSGSIFSLFVLLGVFINCAQVDLLEASNNDLCSDEFNRPDSSDLGDKWEATGLFPYSAPPTVSISNQMGKLDLTLRYIVLACKNRIEHTKSKISLRIQPQMTALANHKFALVARVKNLITDLYLCGFYQNKIALFNVSQGNVIQLAVDNSISSIPAGTTASIIFAMDGASLLCSVNIGSSQVALRTTDSALQVGQVGFFGEGTGGPITVLFDSFKSEVAQ